MYVIVCCIVVYVIVCVFVCVSHTHAHKQTNQTVLLCVCSMHVWLGEWVCAYMCESADKMSFIGLYCLVGLVHRMIDKFNTILSKY